MNDRYQICTRCVMDTTDPEISFDLEGICNHCKRYESICALEKLDDPAFKEAELKRIVSLIKEEGKSKEYDCIIGLSGGVDSSYLAYLALKLGLRPLAVHVDAGWDSELAVKNIELLVKKLGIDLYTHIIDWEEMRDLQLAFLKASVANQDIPQDHAFMAGLLHVTLMTLKNSRGARYILGGNNMATESILPSAWGHRARDLKHLKAIHRKYGLRKLKRFPTLNFFQGHIYYPYIKKIRTVHPLNYMDYNKEEAIKVLQEKLGWRYYGGKHYESVFTKFFQSYYLPEKFGFDKRKAHLSSLIVSGQMAKKEALKELEKPLYAPAQITEDKLYVSKKLGITMGEFDKYLAMPKKSHLDYPSNERIVQIKNLISGFIRQAMHLNIGRI